MLRHRARSSSEQRERIFPARYAIALHGRGPEMKYQKQEPGGGNRWGAALELGSRSGSVAKERGIGSPESRVLSPDSSSPTYIAGPLSWGLEWRSVE